MSSKPILHCAVNGFASCTTGSGLKLVGRDRVFVESFLYRSSAD